MKIRPVALCLCLFAFCACPALAAEHATSQTPAAGQTPAMLQGLFTSCPRKEADAINAVDKRLAMNSPTNDHVAALCLEEYVKYLEKRIKALEAAKTK